MSKMSAFVDNNRPGYIIIPDDEHGQAIYVKDAAHRDELISKLCDVDLELASSLLEIQKSFVEEPNERLSEFRKEVYNSKIDRVLYQEVDAGEIDKHYEEGSSWFSHEVEATPDTLREILGDPTYTFDHFIDGKIQMEWIVLLDNGDTFTIYDWKYYRELDPDETIPWHIGGANEEKARQGAKELLALLVTERTD